MRRARRVRRRIGSTTATRAESETVAAHTNLWVIASTSTSFDATTQRRTQVGRIVRHP